MQDGFAGLHPITNFIYYLMVIGLVIFIPNPCILFLAFLGALAYIFADGGMNVKKPLILGSTMGFLALLINPLFSHQGVTILFYFWDGNPFTLESLIYGMGLFLMVLAMILWFHTLNHIMTSEKWISLFGKIWPGGALLLTMIFRFVPKFNKQGKKLVEVNPKSGHFTVFSQLVTWALETSVDTADSMESRGFGVKKRSAYDRYMFSRQDGVFLVFNGIFFFLVLIAVKKEALLYYCYPSVTFAPFSLFSFCGYLGFFTISFSPCFYTVKEKIRWKYLQSKI